MTALTHRQLALKLAVENASAIESDLVNEPAEFNGVIALANKFVAYLDGDTGASETATPDSEPAAAPARTATDAVDAILAGITAQADRLGIDVVETAQRELGRYRAYTSFGAVIAAANQAINSNAATIGATAADRLRRVVRDAS